MVVKQQLSKGVCTSFFKHVSHHALLFLTDTLSFLAWLVDESSLNPTPLKAENSYQTKGYLLLCHGIGVLLFLLWDRD